MDSDKKLRFWKPGQRVASVDFFRGLTMFLLLAESTRLFRILRDSENPVLHFLGVQLSHHSWNGLHFWDLIQPFFMFIVGVSMPFAFANRRNKGQSERDIFRHVLKRSFLLLLFGSWLYWIGPGHIVLRLQNVLAQLAVTYFVTYLVIDKSYRFQILFSVFLLVITDLAYRYFWVEGFNHPWTPYENLGSYINNWLEGSDKTSIWASVNAIPTTAHTIWGALCGSLLMTGKGSKEKIKILSMCGLLTMGIGYGLDAFHITPIIKKIATMSFVFASGGWAILALAFSYWLIDVKKQIPGLSKFFIYVGANCIFIYLIAELGVGNILYDIFQPVFSSLFSGMNPELVGTLISLSVWFSYWYITYWLYKKRIFFKI